MKNLLLSLLVFLVSTSCGSTKRVSVLNPATPLTTNAVVEVLGVGQKVPEGAKLLGHVKIGDSGFSVKCTYADAIAALQVQARAMGSNIVQITKHTEPNMWSTCHRIQADAYFLKQ